MLSPADIHKLSEHLLRLHASADVRQLADRTANALAALIACDLPGVHIALHHAPPIWVTAWAGDVPEAVVKVSRAVADTHPMFTATLGVSRPDTPETVHGLVSDAEFRRTPLYNEVWRPMRMERELSTRIVQRHNIGLSVARGRGPDFDDRDRAVMQTLHDHVLATILRIAAADNGHLALDRSRVPLQAVDWSVIDGNGNVLRSRPAVPGLLQRYFNWTNPAVLPPAVKRHAIESIDNGTKTLLTRLSGEHQLDVGVNPVAHAPGQYAVFFMERQTAPDPIARLRAMGLTQREAEVVRWVAEGKTNSEIGIILGVSELTAKKHLENVFHKLGVENRATVVARALEAMRTPAPVWT
jgi:DNA-binding CsgD family transcriptional regulator